MKNKYEVRGDVTAIIIESPKYGRLETLISTHCLDKIKQIKGTWGVNWSRCTKTFYVATKTFERGKQGNILIHRVIKDAPQGFVVDHINHDTMDNRDGNLRVVTNAENHQNRNGLYSNNKSGVRGIHWNSEKKKWKACFMLNQKTTHIGYYSDIEEAKKAVIKARRENLPYSVEDAG